MHMFTSLISLVFSCKKKKYSYKITGGHVNLSSHARLSNVMQWHVCMFTMFTSLICYQRYHATLGEVMKSMNYEPVCVHKKLGSYSNTYIPNRSFELMVNKTDFYLHIKVSGTSYLKRNFVTHFARHI